MALNNMKLFSERKILFIILASVVIVIAGIIILYHYSTVAVQPTLTSFVVSQQKDFVATGKRLSKVDIFAVPTGTNIQSSDHQMLEEMYLTSHDPNNQTWQAAIPTEPVLATEIYARGFDDQGKAVGDIALPYTGATEIYNALWNASSSPMLGSTTKNSK